MIGRKQEINLQITQLIDVCLLVLALWLSYQIRFYIVPYFWPEAVVIPELPKFYWLMALIGPFGPVMLESCGFYKNPMRKSLGEALSQIGRGACILGLTIAFFVVFLRWDVPSRSVMLIVCVLAPIFLLARLRLFQRLYNKQWLYIAETKERVLFVGRSVDLASLLENMPGEQRAEFDVVGVYDVDKHNIQDFVQQLHAFSVSRVVFLVKHTHFDKIEDAVQACETEGVDAWLSADFFQTAIARPSFDVFGGRLMLVFHSAPKPSWALMWKNVFDRVGAFVLIVLTLPLWIVAILAIKVSTKGPVFFSQNRSGRFGQPFQMLKFRTMYVDAEARRRELEATNEMEGPVFKMKSDPRIFPVGVWLRRFSIDELPQLINVLRGDMSLVGPRPLPVYEIERIKKRAQRRRLSMKPGLTCLWQVKGRNQITSFEEWVELDLNYIDHWSLGLDFKILALTVPAVLRGSGAR